MKYPETFEEAELAESEAAKIVAQFVALSHKKQVPTNEERRLLEVAEAFVPRGRYEHFKSTSEEQSTYHVLGITDDVNTGLLAVMYVPEYGELKGRVRTRILAGPDSWLRPIDRELGDGSHYRGVRFRMVPDDNTLEVD